MRSARHHRLALARAAAPSRRAVPACRRRSARRSPARSGNAAGCLASAASVSAMRACEFGRLHLVGLGQHDLIADGGLVERLQHVEIDVLEAVPRVDQHVDARERGAAQQEFVDQLGPGRDLGLRRRGIAIAGHVDQPQLGLVGALEEDQLLGAARRVRGARQRVAAGQRVDQARLADIGAAGEGDLERPPSAAASRSRARPR